jgi:hypothetical protein
VSLSASSIFPVDKLPFATIANTSCPFEASRCSGPQDTAFSISTLLLDSHTHFGVNAPENDRILFQKNTTCANVRMLDLTKVVNETIYEIYAGSTGREGGMTTKYNANVSAWILDYILM